MTHDTQNHTPAAIEEEDDDAPVGHVLGRREALALFGAASLAALVACTTPNVAPQATGTMTASTGGTGASGTGAAGATGTAAGGTGTASATASAMAAAPACVVRPAMTEGPYFVDEKLNRSDVRTSSTGGAARPGVPLDITFNVARMATGSCTSLAGAMVDLWQCDAGGVYSDVSDPMNGSSKGQNFLRGFQLTNDAGAAKFTTMYPGWYRGRTVHIHFKIRARNAAGTMQEFTAQLFFDDALSDQVFAAEPYKAKGNRDTRNANDGIYRDGGTQLLLQPTKVGDGYAANFAIGLQIA